METPYYRDMDINQRHSLFGIMSTVIGVISILALCGGLAAILMVASSVADNQWGSAADQQLAIAFVVSMCGAPLSLIGIGLGIGGFFETERQKPFVILGALINIVVILTYLCGLVALVAMVSG